MTLQVQFLLQAPEGAKTINAPGASIPAVGDKYLLHTLASDKPTPWRVTDVVRELWPGLSDFRMGTGRARETVDPSEYHEGGSVVVVMEPAFEEMVYDEHFGDDKECECGHDYYRHFDTYDNMSPVGCKYCGCGTWKAPPLKIVPKGEGSDGE